MVVVVTDPILVKGRRPGWLDAPNEALLGQHSKGVVDGLTRDGTDLGANFLGDGIRRGVRSARNRSQHCQALGCDWDAILAKKVGWINHDIRLKQLLDRVKKSI